MKMRWIIICCFVLLIGGGIFTVFTQLKQDTNDIMQFTIYPTGTSEETYYFVLNQDGILKCSVGSRKNDNIKQRDYLIRTVDSAEILLDEHNMQVLIDVANQLEISGFNEEKRVVKDSWDVAFLYKGKFYEMNWHMNNSEILRKLADIIIELSPIPVDLHDWA